MLNRYKMGKLEDLETDIARLLESQRKLHESVLKIVEKNERNEYLLGLYRDAVRVDAPVSGPAFAGSNISALKRAWEEDT